MKKHLIAAAGAAAVAVPAAAQVTVYGILDMGYSNESITIDSSNTKTSGINRASGLSSSRLGFRWAEDLGGGMKAEFIVETGLTTNGTANVLDGTSRAANLNLTGGFGSLRIGRQNSIGKNMVDGFTAFGGGASFTQGSAAKETLEGGKLSPSTANTSKNLAPAVDRVSEAITYTSPNFGGVTVSLSAADTKSDKDAETGESRTKGYAGQVSYVAGPLTVAIAHTSVEQDIEKVTEDDAIGKQVAGVTAAAGRERDVNQLGAKYSIGAATLFAHISNGEYKANSTTAALDTESFDLGVTYKIGATTLLASFGQGEMETSATAKRDIEGHQVQAHYALSKRTTAYILHGKTESELSGSATDKTSVTMMGLRHSF